MVSLLDLAGSLSRGLRRKPTAKRNRSLQDQRLRTAIDQLENRLALAITTPLTIGGTTVGTFTDAPTGPGNLGDFVTVSIEGTRGSVIFNGGNGVADGTDIQTIEIVNASPDFQLTFNGLIRTASPVPYGSDGIVQLGTITTTNVIRGINTVRGPATNVAISSPPNGFTQSSAGTSTVTLAGDQTTTFAVDQFTAATPLLPSSGTTVFSSVSSTSYDANTDTTTVTLGSATGGSTTAGALTTAETRNVEFQLTKFVGVNFSNLNLKEGGGLFVDTVLGDEQNVGVVLSNGLLAYSTIGIRKQLDATMRIGTTNRSSADGRVFIESATPESVIVVGPQTTKTSQNSKFELVGGAGEFGASVTVNQVFNGVMNIGGASTGLIGFTRGVGSLARLNARSWNNVLVNGDFAGMINSTATGDELAGNVPMLVSRNVTSTARINSESNVSLGVGGSIQSGAIISADQGVFFSVLGNVAGTINAGSDNAMTGSVTGSLTGATLSSSNDILLNVGGSIVNSTLAADDQFSLNVAGSIRNSTLTSGDSEITFDVGGNVLNSKFAGGISGTVAGSVTNSTFFAEGASLDDADPDITLAVGRDLTGSAVQAVSQVTVNVAGSIAKSRFISTTSDVTVDVGGSITDSTLISADDGVTLTAGRDALNLKIVADDSDSSLTVARNFSGSLQSGSGNVFVDVGGSVLKGSSFLTGGNALFDVTGNFDGSVEVQDLRFFVGGNVSKDSRIVAQQVTDWQDAGDANFTIGGRLNGVVNVGVFDAAPNEQTVTILGNGAGQGARFYVDRFETDTLVFNGNFLGNMRVLQDLVANLTFNGNVDRITIGGRVGSYGPGATPIVAAINVAGRLLYMNTNSYFEATGAGKKNGVFWNDSTKTSSTGSLTTGSYVTVVPTLQQVSPPTPPTPQTYTAPTAPTSFSAALSGAAGIQVSFSAPTSNGGLPVVYYEFTTDNGSTWRRFTNPAQGPGSNIVLPGPSAGGSAPFSDGTYDVAVRAVNAIGATATSTQQVTVAVNP